MKFISGKLRKLHGRIVLAEEFIWPYTISCRGDQNDTILNLSRPIYIFYHIYCGNNNFEGIIKEQYDILGESGLADVATNIFVGISGSPERRELTKNLLKSEKTVVVYESDNGDEYEFPVLRKMQELAHDGDFYALYFHTKGSSYTRTGYENGEYKRRYGDYETFLNNNEAWRRLMEYFNIHRWRQAIAALSNGYNTYGCLLKHKYRLYWDRPHYSGNFWWSTSENIRQCHPLDEEYTKDRYNAEFWIVNDLTKAASAFNCPVHLAAFLMPESAYTKHPLHPQNLRLACRFYKFVFRNGMEKYLLL